jgi:putative ABC transport system permease protein
MQVRHIAFASLKRRRAKVAFVLAAVALGIGTLVALVSLSRAMEQEIADELDRFGANIIVTPKARSLDLAYGGLALGGVTVESAMLTDLDVAKVRSIHHGRRISAVAPKLAGTVELAGRQVLLVGVNFRQERGLKSWWEIHGAMPASHDEVLAGAEIARALGLAPGHTLLIHGRTLRVAGIGTPTGSVEDAAILADLARAQQILGRPGAVSFIEISALCKGCPIDEIVGQLAAALPHARVAPIRQAVAARERAVLQFTRFGYAVAALVLIVSALVVLTTTMSAVVERTQELGVLRAVGFRRAQIARVVLIETIVAAAAGGLAGWVAGSAVAWCSGPALADLAGRVPPDSQLALASLGIAAAIGVCGGTYPALRAARMDPAHALRHF